MRGEPLDSLDNMAGGGGLRTGSGEGRGPESPTEQLPELLNDELLTCRICYCAYGRGEDELPKLLRCSHTFCLRCIKLYLKKRKKFRYNKFPCPLCRRETTLPKTGPIGLGNDFTVLNLIDILERQKSPVPEPPTLNFNVSTPVRADSSQLSTTNSTLGSSSVYKKRLKPSSSVGLMMKWNTGIENTSTDRPPPINPDFVPASSDVGALPKPSVPPRIPGAATTMGERKGRHIGSLLSRQRPQSMRFPSAPRSKPLDLDSPQSDGEEDVRMSPVRRNRSYSAPRPPPRRVSSNSFTATPLKCVRRFGKYSETRMQTSAFQQPTRISISQVSGDVLVIDSVQMNLQLFTKDGAYITMFKVLGIQSACFYGSDRILVATHRGLLVYKLNGEQLEEFITGQIKAVVPYRFGFVAAKQKELCIYSNTLKLAKKLSKVKTSRYNLRSSSFKCVQDVCVNALKELVILDTGHQKIYVTTSEGIIRATVTPTTEACRILRAPEAIAVDKWNNIIVSDSGNKRVLKFSANGTFSRCLLNFELWSGTGGIVDRELTCRGAVMHWEQDRLYAVITGTKTAYVGVYQQ